jgi:hypothetical protein
MYDTGPFIWDALVDSRNSRTETIEMHLAHVPAAVDVDGLAGDVGVGGEQHGNLRYFLRGSEALDGQKARLNVLVTLNHVGVDQRGSDGVGGDAFFRQ